jgi:transglutaminase-like putative cysteine protease
MNRYRLFHITEFNYDGPVSESYNEVRLRPLQDEMQSCLSFRLSTEPISSTSSYLDFFGNWVHQFNILRDHRSLKIEAECVVLVHAPKPPAVDGMPMLELAGMQEYLADEFYDLLAPSVFIPHTRELSGLAELAERESNGTVGSFVEAAVTLIHSRFKYEKGATHVNSSIQDSLQSRSGVCQDFAHLLIGLARVRGLPARYVSGYLVPKKTAELDASVEEVIGGQASHAWTEVYVPHVGWVGQDPTLGRATGLQHIRVAYGRDYGDVPPVRGVYKGHAGQRLSVDVRVRPALDNEGHELLQETAAGPVEIPAEEEPPQQQQQQQQQ